MKKYDLYKGSAVEWIGEVPNHWKILKFKYVFTEKKSIKNLNLNSGSISFGEVIYKDDDKIPKFTKESYQEVLEGEFLVNPLNLNYDLKSLRIGISSINVVVSQGYIVLKILEGYNPYYFKYFLREFDIHHMKSLGQGVRQTISFTHLSNEILLCPPLSEQEKIVSFLDSKTTLISSLIEKSQRKIELYKEKRSSLISEVVTKGLNPNVEMKNSGIEWIGKIPRSWNILRICFIFKPISIKNTSGEMNLSVYRDYGVIPTHSRNDNHNVISEDTSNYKLVEKGDFVMNKMKCWMGSLGLSDYRGIVSPAYIVMKPLIDNYHKYIHYLLRSKLYIPQYKRFSYGVRESQWDLRFENFRELPCLIPPIEEQQQIVKYLDKQTELIEKKISIEEKRIELLKEYRQSLISEVVTGKQKVF